VVTVNCEGGFGSSVKFFIVSDLWLHFEFGIFPVLGIRVGSSIFKFAQVC